MTTNLYWHQTFLIRFSSSLLCILPTTPTSSSLHFVSVFPPFVSYLSSSFFLLLLPPILLPPSPFLLLPPPPFPSPSSSLIPLFLDYNPLTKQITDIYKVFVSPKKMYLEPFLQRGLHEYHWASNYGVYSLGRRVRKSSCTTYLCPRHPPSPAPRPQTHSCQ